MEIRFGYKKFGLFYRPVIPVQLRIGKTILQYEALLDSGADICIFHSEIGELLGAKMGLTGVPYFLYTFLTMLQTVRISSKRQITIPSKIFNSLGLKKGDRLVVRLDAKIISMQKGLDLLDELQGSLKLPGKYKGKSEDAIIEAAKGEYFR